MKAIVYREYGAPDVLQVEKIEKPSLKDDEVLIRIRATIERGYPPEQAADALAILRPGTSRVI